MNIRFFLQRRAQLLSAGFLVAAAIFPSGCDNNKPPSKTTAADATARPDTAAAAKPSYTFSDFPVPPKPADTAALVQHGKDVYMQNCAACHGEKGDGHGVCSAFLIPSPRNFTGAHFKLRSTIAGHLPTDEDLFRAVSLGLKGTPMPPWKWLLDDTDRWAVVEYIKTFSPRFASTNEDRSPLAEPANPPAKTDAMIAEGKALYAKLACNSCHGETGEGNGPSAARFGG